MKACVWYPSRLNCWWSPTVEQDYKNYMLFLHQAYMSEIELPIRIKKEFTRYAFRGVQESDQLSLLL